MSNRVDLEDGGGTRTIVRWSSDATVSGTLANVGARLIQLSADRITRDLFACIKATLES